MTEIWSHHILAKAIFPFLRVVYLFNVRHTLFQILLLQEGILDVKEVDDTYKKETLHRQGYCRPILNYAMSNMGVRCVCSLRENVCAMTHSLVRRDLFLCVTRLIFMCDMAREYMMAQIYFDGNTWSHRNFEIDDGICICVFIYIYTCVYVCIYL